MTDTITKETAADTHPIKCPVCNTRLCDAVSPETHGSIRTTTKHGSGILQIKCHKCKKTIGIMINN